MSLLFCWYVPIAKSLRVEHERWCFRNLLLACTETCSAPCHRVTFDQIHPPVFLLRPESMPCLYKAQGLRAVLSWPWKENGLVRAWKKIEGTMVFPGGASGKEPTCQFRRQKRLRFDPWVGKIPWTRGATHSSILAWRIPWIEEPGRLPSITLQSWTQLKRLACMCAGVI